MPRIHPKPGSRRQAAILMVTIVLLTLFLVIGLCFVLFAESQATSSRIYREANNNIADVYDTAHQLFSYALGQLVYDTDDVNGGQYSSMRGYSLARNMYGWNYTFNQNTLQQQSTLTNSTPFNGSGRLHTGGGTYMNPYNTDDQLLLNYQYFASDGFRRDPEFYQQYAASASPPPSPNGLYTGGVNPPYTAPDMNHVFLAAIDDQGNVTVPSFWRGPQVGMTINTNTADPAWTDPTQPVYKYKSLRPRPADQLTTNEIATPGQNTQAYVQSLLAANQIFPMPASNTGDVRNMPGPGPNDSIWMDLGYPYKRLAGSGIKVKPLFAFLIVDMDGRVNYNIAGNVRESASVNYGYHGSIQGWGPWEVNLRQTMPQTNNPFGAPFPAGGSTQDYLNTFAGVGGSYGGRYGNKPGQVPDLPPYPPPPPTPFPQFPYPNAVVPGGFAAPSGSNPKYYNHVDFNGSSLMAGSTNGPAKKVTMPAAPSFTAFPGFPTHYEDGNADERYFHPRLLNPFNLNQPSPGTDLSAGQLDHNLPINDVQNLICWMTPRTPASLGGPPYAISPDTSNTWIAQLWPNNIKDYPNLRNVISPLTMDMDLPGAAPGQPTSPLTLDLTANPPGIKRVPSGSPTKFPSIGNRNGPSPGGDLNATDWKSILPLLGKVDLNRPLSAYPAPQTPGGPVNILPMTQLNPVYVQYQHAVRDRQNLAMDIFTRLWMATGWVAPDNTSGPIYYAVNPPSAGDKNFAALRYLAQIAVNIVDYIDDDDVITEFFFIQGKTDPWSRVYGTEMPRIVINEAYGQIENMATDTFGVGGQNYQPGGIWDPDTPSSSLNPMTDPAFPNPMPNPPPKLQNGSMFQANFFAELYNPHANDANLSNNGAAMLQFSKVNGMPFPTGQSNIYQLVIQSGVDQAGTRNPDNTLSPQAIQTVNGHQVSYGVNLGSPWPPQPVANPTIYTAVTDFTDDRTNAQNFTVNPAAVQGTYSGQGFYVLGPSTTTGVVDPKQGNFPHDRSGGNTSQSGWDFNATTATKQMQYSQLTPTLAATAVSNQNYPSMFLQRLANPYLPPNPYLDDNSTPYNPYVTVDYIQNVQLYDSILVDTSGARPGARTGVDQRASWGRMQPFKASVLMQQSPQPASTNQAGQSPPSTAMQTFFTQNGQSQAAPGPTLDQPFNWLTFGDRIVVSPADLLHVSAYMPHELTQEFMNPQYGPASPAQFAAHEIPWRNPQTRLYRALELMGARSQMYNAAFGGRLPGKININTMVGQEVWNALCDADVSNSNRHYFTQTMLNNLYTNNAIPTPNAWGGITAPPVAGPIWGTSVPWAGTGGNDPQYPSPSSPSWMLPNTTRTGVDNTIIGNPYLPGNGGLLQLGNSVANDSYVQEELLKKITNSFTTRSNVFAVYVTTGWFVVRDDSVNPVKLGQEISASLRHKMFAVVDRTNLSIATDPTTGQPLGTTPLVQGNRPIYFPYTPANGETMIQQGALNSSNVYVTTGCLATNPGPGSYVCVRDTIDHFNNDYTPLSSINGSPTGSGALFQITMGSVLFLDVGVNQEVVTVSSMQPNQSNPGQSIIQFKPVGGGTFKHNHYAGCAICTALIGNPGPQASANLPYDDPTQPYWNTVLPLATILQ